VLVEHPPDLVGVEVDDRRAADPATDHSSRSILRSSGKSRIQRSATKIVPRPPRTTAGTVPKSAAVMPLSNSPSWFDALMKR
jgi:hypothetical protein